jgi:hypothetical protein
MPSIYIYNEIQHLLQWLVVIRMQLQPIVSALWNLRLRVDVLGVKAGFYVGSLTLIGASHQLHTHSRSTLYIKRVSAPATVASGHKDAAPA